MKLFAWIHKIFTMHIGTMYGDQSIFVLSSVFQELGGFRGMPLMEDVSFSSRLREYGPVKVIAPPLRSSNRKFLKEGHIKRKIRQVVLCPFLEILQHVKEVDLLLLWRYNARVKKKVAQQGSGSTFLCPDHHKRRETCRALRPFGGLAAHLGPQWARCLKPTR